MESTSNTMQASPRYLMLDYARVITALLVIYGHLYTPDPDNHVRVFIYQFHMALFFVISGMLHKYNGNVQIKKYIRTIIIPIITFSFVYFLMSTVLYQYGCGGGYKEAVPYNIIKDNLLGTLYSYMVFSIIGIIKGESMLNGPLWFLIALFYCKIMMDWFCKHQYAYCVIWLLFFVALCIYRHKYFFVSNGIIAMPFYYCGYKYKSLFIKINTFHNKIPIICLSFIVICFIMKYNGTVSMWSIKFGNLPKLISVPLFYIVGVSGTILILSFSSLLRMFPQFINVAAKSLISILGLQIPFIFIIDNMIGYNLDYISSLFIAVFILLACIFLHLLLEKKVPWAIGQIK